MNQKLTKIAILCLCALAPMLMAPRNGAGTYQLPAGNPVVSGTAISSTVHNNTNSDIATALTGSLAKDGQTTPTANLPMGAFRHTNVGNATARNQYGTVDQIQDGDYASVGSVAGTNTVTGSLSPSLSAYVAGMQVVLIPANANTGSTTLNLNSVGALDVQKYTSAGQVAVAANDLRAGIPALLLLDSGGDDWILLNPYSGSLGDVTIGALTATSVTASGTVGAATVTSSGAVTATGAVTGSNFNGFANPSASIGLSAVNGSAITAMRSDGAPALSQSIVPTWTGSHTFSNGNSYSAPTIKLSNAFPILTWNQVGAAANNGIWTLGASSEQMIFQIVNDAFNTTATWLAVDRTGTTVDTIAFASTALTWNGSAMVNLGSSPTWTGAHTFSNTAATLFSSSGGSIAINDTGGASNQKYAKLTHVANAFQIQGCTDGGGSCTNAITIGHTGATIDSVALAGTSITAGGSRLNTVANSGKTAYGRVNGTAVTNSLNVGAATNGSTGNYTLDLTAAGFSESPVCTATAETAAFVSLTTTSTSAAINTKDTAAANVNVAFKIACSGN